MVYEPEDDEVTFRDVLHVLFGDWIVNSIFLVAIGSVLFVTFTR